jgi:DHA1 family bicyclomycin/chloramphenicol resistance-like MFS transporter
VVSPLVMHSPVALAATSLGLMCLGLCAWLFIRRRWPDIGQHVLHA